MTFLQASSKRKIDQEFRISADYCAVQQPPALCIPGIPKGVLVSNLFHCSALTGASAFLLLPGLLPTVAVGSVWQTIFLCIP